MPDTHRAGESSGEVPCLVSKVTELAQTVGQQTSPRDATHAQLTAALEEAGARLQRELPW